MKSLVDDCYFLANMQHVLISYSNSSKIKFHEINVIKTIDEINLFKSKIAFHQNRYISNPLKKKMKYSCDTTILFCLTHYTYYALFVKVSFLSFLLLLDLLTPKRISLRKISLNSFFLLLQFQYMHKNEKEKFVTVRKLLNYKRKIGTFNTEQNSVFYGFNICSKMGGGGC